MVPMIVRVLCEDGVTDVPITPETTCFDVIECCRDPGDDLCALVEVWRDYERVLQDEEKPLEILQEWGPKQDEVKFILRYTVLNQSNLSGESKITRNGMKEQGLLADSLPDGVELSLWELQEMATRQQHQIESQHQILVAKEQRLRYLKHQEARNHQVAAENERLRRLKERVEAQELKLRKLRALRGQVDQDKITNGTLTSDLDSIRALFNEKEKELSLAVAKVEELTRQLEELKRNGRTKEAQPPASAALELDKLRRELLFRNKLKEQQSAQLNQQRDALNQRQEEIDSIDKRITELQDRLHRKRLLNQQLANHLQHNNNNNNNRKQVIGCGVRSAKSTLGLLSNYQNQRSNIAAVEPYLHIPNAYHQDVTDDLIKPNDNRESTNYQKHTPSSKIHQEGQNEGIINENKKNKAYTETKEDKQSNYGKDELTKIIMNELKSKDNNNDYLTEFSASKSDPKYQTLPYNTKFTINRLSKNLPYQNGLENYLEMAGDKYSKSTGVVNPVGGQQQQQQQQPLMTVHSTPIPAPSLSNASKIPSHLNPRVYGHQMLGVRGQPVGGASPSSSTSSLATSSSSSCCSNHSKSTYLPPVSNGNATPLQQCQQQQQRTSQLTGKPISSVAPINVVQKTTKSFIPGGDKPSPIYQTSSMKILPVQPQTLKSTPQGLLREIKRESSPSFSTSTPITSPEAPSEKTANKPALPPKPAVPVKPTPPPPPRQTHVQDVPEAKGYIEITAESLDQALNFTTKSGNATAVDSGIGDGRRENFKANNDEVPFGSDRSRTPTPPPPPPPATEPPDDLPLRFENVETTSKDDKTEAEDCKLKSNQSTNLVNCNYSGKQLYNIKNLGTNGSSNGNYNNRNSNSDVVINDNNNNPNDDDYNIYNDDSNFYSDRNSHISNNVNINYNNIFNNSESSDRNNNDSSNNSNSVECNANGSEGGGDDNNNNNIRVGVNRRIEMPPAFMFPENEKPPADLVQTTTTTTTQSNDSSDAKILESNLTKTNGKKDVDEMDRVAPSEDDVFISNIKIEDADEKSDADEVEILNNINCMDMQNNSGESVSQQIVRRVKKGNLKSSSNKSNGSRRVSFDPLALLLDASLEGELELVVRTASQVPNPSAANDEGITALHNAICAGHLDIVKFLVEFGCDVNAQDSDGWTPLHCAASCNNLAMVRFLVEHGACIFATTLSDHETAAEKCEEDEEGFDGCSEYLYSIQEKLGILNNGIVYAVYDYAAHNSDELSFSEGDRLIVLRKGDDLEREWWWSRLQDKEGYAPRNLLGLYPRVQTNRKDQ